MTTKTTGAGRIEAALWSLESLARAAGRRGAPGVHGTRGLLESVRQLRVAMEGDGDPVDWIRAVRAAFLATDESDVMQLARESLDVLAGAVVARGDS